MKYLKMQRLYFHIALNPEFGLSPPLYLPLCICDLHSYLNFSKQGDISTKKIVYKVWMKSTWIILLWDFNYIKHRYWSSVHIICDDFTFLRQNGSSLDVCKLCSVPTGLECSLWNLPQRYGTYGDITLKSQYLQNTTVFSTDSSIIWIFFQRNVSEDFLFQFSEILNNFKY